MNLDKTKLEIHPDYVLLDKYRIYKDRYYIQREDW